MGYATPSQGTMCIHILIYLIISRRNFKVTKLENLTETHMGTGRTCKIPMTKLTLRIYLQHICNS